LILGGFISKIDGKFGGLLVNLWVNLGFLIVNLGILIVNLLKNALFGAKFTNRRSFSNETIDKTNPAAEIVYLGWKNTEKWAKMGQKWTKMGQNELKLIENGRKVS
jgi:hypothetical protein